jgi:ABC-type lipoprotein release transport system permease subunit
MYRFKTVVISMLLGSAAFLTVLGLSLLRDVEASMRSSIIESVSGHLQIYSSKAKDELALFGSMIMGRSEVGTLPDFAPIRDEVLQNSNVKSFVPMGIDMSMLGRGNELDESIEALRAALKSGEPVNIQDKKDHLRFQFAQLRREHIEKRKIYQNKKDLDEQDAALSVVESKDYLESLTLQDEAKIQFLETKIAPLSGEKTPVYLMYMGTDIGLYRKNFSKFKLLEGEELPEGQRGILLSHKIRETQLKNMVARIFDRLNKRVIKNGIPIAGDPESTRDVSDLQRQYSQILVQLDRKEAEEISRKLTEFGIAPVEAEKDLITALTGQLKSFLVVNDESFAKRFKWFYDNIAPLMKLYELSPGETIVLKSYTRSGYLKSLPIKVYGVYTFAGLEDSDIAGAANIIDLLSFRELYGQMTESSRKELDEMNAKVGIREVNADDAESQLFGEQAPQNIESKSLLNESAAPVAEVLNVKQVISNQFELSEVSRGLALNAAIILKDPSKLQETRKKLEKDLKAKGYEVQVIDWQQASGFTGQFVNIVRMALLFVIIVIFAVSLVIINNSIIVETFNRIREIGTMRAMGAQKTFVLGLFLAETGLTGFFGSLIGTAFAVALLMILGQSGIPAVNDVVTFLFSGSRLYPTFDLSLAVGAPLVVTLIATLTSVYAARHAAQIKPAEAMQEKE